MSDAEDIYEEGQDVDDVDDVEDVEEAFELEDEPSDSETDEESEEVSDEDEPDDVVVDIPPPTKDTFGAVKPPKFIKAHIVPAGSEHVLRRLDRNLLGNVLATRVRDLESRGDDQGHLSPEEIKTLPPGNRYQTVAMTEILLKKCPYSARRTVARTRKGEPVIERVPINDMILAIKPVWPHPESR